jgi:aryl-alcohol dehydrogenase-like predicted oxidoreductase
LPPGNPKYRHVPPDIVWMPGQLTTPQPTGAEEILGDALKGRRDQFLIVSKVFQRMGKGPHDVGLSRKRIVEGCEASLRRLQTDYLDLYLCHEPDQIVPLEESLRAFDDLVRQG